ncbi:GtrA family protein [Dermacoccus nishinomiyaensis]|uniref:GtrA family protein n=1 Tax=Dermacoccus nishinomiyaensis TaxID=1274 RepID=UPI000DFD3180|nr:GtrA family protein [Dermacoccus nishinomiyaensis]QQY24774.1 GtrA family protein [Dermacoccus nishinomiyaensis]STD19285.1 GtrA-like protein [Dermacoccus nishinomiyaensis]
MVTTQLRRLWARNEIRYLVVAGTTQVVYLSTFVLGLLAHLHYMLAIGVAQVLTIAAAFPAYRTLVFASTNSVASDYLRFLSVWTSGALAGLVMTPFLVEVLGMPPFVAQVIAIAVVAVGSYLGHRFFSFRPKAPAEAHSSETASSN